MLAVAVTVAAVATTAAAGHGHRVNHSVRPAPLLGPSTSLLTATASEPLPEAFDWRDIQGRSMVTADVNQHVPVYCVREASDRPTGHHVANVHALHALPPNHQRARPLLSPATRVRHRARAGYMARSPRSTIGSR